MLKLKKKKLFYCKINVLVFVKKIKLIQRYIYFEMKKDIRIQEDYMYLN